MAKRILLFISFAIVIGACKKDDPPLFTIPVQNVIFSVDPTMQPPFTYYIPVNNVMTNAMNLITAQGIDTSEIKSIRPGKASLQALFGQGDLDFLDAVSVRLCPIGSNKENCGQEVFYRDPVPLRTGIDLDLVPSNVNDVRDFVLPDRINIQVKLERLRDFPKNTFDVRLDMEFEVR